jgi:hypothetical protein
MGLTPFIRSIVGGSRFPRMIGQELPNPAPVVTPVTEEVVNSADSVKPKVKKPAVRKPKP